VSNSEWGVEVHKRTCDRKQLRVGGRVHGKRGSKRLRESRIPRRLGGSGSRVAEDNLMLGDADEYVMEQDRLVAQSELIKAV